MAAERGPQLSVPFPTHRIDVLNAAYHALNACKLAGKGPQQMNEMVAEALAVYMQRLSKQVNDGEPFDPEIGARLRAAATRSRRPRARD